MFNFIKCLIKYGLQQIHGPARSTISNSTTPKRYCNNSNYDFNIIIITLIGFFFHFIKYIKSFLWKSCNFKFINQPLSSHIWYITQRNLCHLVGNIILKLSFKFRLDSRTLKDFMIKIVSSISCIFPSNYLI
jgi:hypothetical protein